LGTRTYTSTPALPLFHEVLTLLLSTMILEGPIQVKAGKLKAGRGQLLSRPSALPRSQPGSPALAGTGSPSLGPTSNNAAQEKARKLRFPLIHELAARDQTFGDLQPKWQGETDADFHTHLEKVANFEPASQKWTLKKNCWFELDVFAYPYAKEDDRQRAIDNAIRKYDQKRLPVSDPLWQKLLPISERGKGICLSKVQAAIAKGPAAPAPKINVQSPKASSPSVDSEREDSGSSSTNKAKVGSEPMARTNSGSKTKKVSEAQAQAKRLMSGKPAKTAAPKPTSKPSSAKTSPKVSPTKPASKAGTGKGGRVLSKEFISDSDSDSSEEAPLSKTTAASKRAHEIKDLKKATAAKADTVKATTPKPKQQPAERATEQPKPVEKPRDVPVPKAKPAPAKSNAPAPKIMDSIRAEGAKPKPVRAPKRSRDDDEDDSSSSGTPLSKRLKQNRDHAVSKPRPSEPPAAKHRKSDSSQNSRSSQSSTSSAKAKTSPVKSSPLASSPPTNASEIDAAAAADERDTIAVVAAKKRKFESTARAGEKKALADRYDKSQSSAADPYDKSDSSDSSLIKRAKHGHGRSSNGAAEISEATRKQAHRFKTFYTQYEALHRELSALEDPPEEQVQELLEMHNRLCRIKDRIRRDVGDGSQ